MQKQPELVRGGFSAGGPIGGKVRLPRLDVIFRGAAPAIDVVIERTSVSGRQVRDDEAGVCPVGAGLDARDAALDPAPAGGAQRAIVLASRHSICRRKVAVGSTPKMKSTLLARHQARTSVPQ